MHVKVPASIANLGPGGREIKISRKADGTLAWTNLNGELDVNFLAT